MTSVTMKNDVANHQLAQSKEIQNKANVTKNAESSAQIEKQLVNISAEGKALQAASTKIETADKGEKTAERNVTDEVESFAYGALGMEHPDEVMEETDGSYTAGQYLKGALTIGGLILAIV